MKQKPQDRKDHFLADGFARLVFVYAAQNIALSITGIIDTAATGRFIGEEGLAAMKLALPVFSIIGLFGNLMSSGLSIQVSREIAKGRSEKAAQSFLWTGNLAVVISALLMLSGLFFPQQVSALLNGNEASESIREQMIEYLIPILIGTLPVISYYILSTMAALEGGEKYLTASSATIIVADVMGDWLAVKLHWGMMGIAVASIGAYLAADTVVCLYFLKHHIVLRRDKKAPKDWKCLGEIVRSGMPMAVKYICTILCPILINYLMLKYGNVIGLAALSVQDAVHYVPEALCKGIASAVLLMTGMLFTEQDHQMLNREKIYVSQYSLVFGTIVAAVMSIFARPILCLFTTEPDLILSGTTALRWYLLGVPFACINFSVTAYLQSMKKRNAANSYILLNRLLLPVGITWVLGRRGGMEGIYASFAISEIASALLFGAEQIAKSLIRGARTPGSEEWDELIAELHRNVTTIRQATEVSEEIFNLCLLHQIGKKQAGQIALCMEELAVNSI